MNPRHVGRACRAIHVACMPHLAFALTWTPLSFLFHSRPRRICRCTFSFRSRCGPRERARLGDEDLAASMVRSSIAQPGTHIALECDGLLHVLMHARINACTNAYAHGCRPPTLTIAAATDAAGTAVCVRRGARAHKCMSEHACEHTNAGRQQQRRQQRRTQQARSCVYACHPAWLRACHPVRVCESPACVYARLLACLHAGRSASIERPVERRRYNQEHVPQIFDQRPVRHSACPATI